MPYNTDVENRTDLVEFKSFNEKNSKKLNKRNQTPVGVVDTETALEYVGVAIWRKLYARELFSKIRFPAGMVYEDMAVSHKLIFEAKRIVMIDDVLYFHVYRKGSITNTRSVKNSRDAFISTFRRVEDMNSYGLLLEKYERSLVSRTLTYLSVSNQRDGSVFKQAEEVIDSTKRIPSMLKMKKKAMFMVWKTDKRLFYFICKVLGQKE